MRRILAIAGCLLLALIALRWLTAASNAQTEAIQDRLVLQLRDAGNPPVPAPKPLPNARKAIWAFSFEQTDKGALIRAAIDKKNELTILCDHVDLQTQKGTLQAQGKVSVSAEGLQARCDKLTITLHDDTVLLDGNAEVSIIRPRPYSDQKDPDPPTPERLLELKGAQLSLRWPEIRLAATLPNSATTPALQVPPAPADLTPLPRIVAPPK